MAYKKAKSPAEVQKVNTKAFKTWATKNSGLIKAKPGKTVFYTGNHIELMIKKIEKIHNAQTVTIKGETAKAKKERLKEAKELKTGVWKALEDAQKGVGKVAVPKDFEDINTVLRRIKSHPPLIDRNGNEKQCAHMGEYMDEIKRLSDLFPKSEVSKAWSLLSQCFAKNAEGQIKVLDGVEQDFRNVGGHKDFVKHEIPALLKNTSLSKETRAELEALAGKYMAKFEAETRKIVRDALAESKKLKSAK